MHDNGTAGLASSLRSRLPLATVPVFPCRMVTNTLCWILVGHFSLAAAQCFYHELHSPEQWNTWSAVRFNRSKEQNKTLYNAAKQSKWCTCLTPQLVSTIHCCPTRLSNACKKEKFCCCFILSFIVWQKKPEHLRELHACWNHLYFCSIFGPTFYAKWYHHFSVTF